jgi:hypothetical protein
MRTVSYHGNDAIFKFDMDDVINMLNYYVSEYKSDEAKQLIELLSSSTLDLITVPEENEYFEYIIIDLIDEGKGSAICKTCNKTYQASNLKLSTVGHGTSPFNIDEKHTGWLNMFKKKKRNPPMFGGKEYKCPEGHSLLSKTTWMT